MDDAITVVAELPGSAASSHAEGECQRPQLGSADRGREVRHTAAANCSGWARSDRQRLAVDCTPRQAILPRKMLMMIDCAITRVGKGVLRARRSGAARSRGMTALRLALRPASPDTQPKTSASRFRP